MNESIDPVQLVNFPKGSWLVHHMSNVLKSGYYDVDFHHMMYLYTHTKAQCILSILFLLYFHTFAKYFRNSQEAMT